MCGSTVLGKRRSYCKFVEVGGSAGGRLGAVVNKISSFPPTKIDRSHSLKKDQYDQERNQSFLNSAMYMHCDVTITS